LLVVWAPVLERTLDVLDRTGEVAAGEPNRRPAFER
jgi:hypothetical protein